MLADHALLSALPVAVYTTDAEGYIRFFNEAAATLWGHRPRIGVDQWCGSWRLYWTDGRPMRHDECPMAIALKEGRTVLGAEAILERPDGTRVFFTPYPSPLRDENGRVTGAINLLVDLTERAQSEAAAARLAAIVQSSDDAIVSKTLEGRVTSWNAGAAHIFGYTEEEMIGQSIKRIIPQELWDEEEDILAKLRRGERVQHYETVRVAKDGRRIDISLTVSPLRDRRGHIIGASKVARDVTERKQAEALRQLLTDELDHRVKNTLASVQAIANQSLRHARNPGDFVGGFSGRIQALARAHSLLTHTHMAGSTVAEIVRDQVLLGGQDARITCSGPMVQLATQETVHLSLVLHELATNARKYGALSAPRGQLVVTWSTRTNDEGRELLLDWKEHSGPTVQAPTAAGFGTNLIQTTMRGHGGEAAIRYAADGISCALRMRLRETTGLIESLLPTLREARTQYASAREAPERRCRILVVEDEPLVAMDIEAILAAAGHEVVGPVATAERAAEEIAGTPPDFALLDVNLGGTSVEDIAAALVQGGIPFAFATGYGRTALPPGFENTPVLRKPFSEVQLMALIRDLVERSTSHDAEVIPLRAKGG